MTGERAGDINIMTVDGVSGSNNVFINGNNNVVTNNYYVQIGSNAADLDHLITLIMNLTQQDETDGDIFEMVNDVLDIAREHVTEEPEPTEETIVSLPSTTEISTSVDMTTTSTTTTSTSTTSQMMASVSTSAAIKRSTQYEAITLKTITSLTSESVPSKTTTKTTPALSTSFNAPESITKTTSTTTSLRYAESEPLDVQLKLPSSIDRRCPTCASSKSVSACFKTQTTCSSGQVCSIALRSRNARIESVTMGCKQRHACHTDNRQNEGQCRPWMRNGPSVCRTCCNGPACYVTLQKFKTRPFRSAVSSWSKLF